MSGESNSTWGAFVAQDHALAAKWDACDPLPEHGEWELWDRFRERKRTTDQAWRRLGARLDETKLAVPFPEDGAIKYRDLLTDARHIEPRGAVFKHLKIVPAGPNPAETVIVVEGESDAARVIGLFPSCDVAMLPTGAKAFKPEFAEQLKPYPQVLVGTDNDEAGEVGWAKIAEHVGHAQRFAPPEGKDWCAFGGQAPPLPDVPTEDEQRRAAAARVLRSYKKIKPLRTTWLWAGRVPKAMLTIVVGTEGLGKTALMVETVAKLTRGTLPGCYEGEPVNVALLTPEDDPARTIRPRLEASGADPERCFQIKTRSGAGDSGLSLPKDTELLIDALLFEQVRFVVLDPLPSILDPAVNTWKDTDIRGALEPLVGQLAVRGITVIGALHTNKSNSTDARERGMGSVGWRTIARSVLVAGLDPDSPEGARGPERCLAHDKCNVGEKQRTLTFTLTPAEVSVEGETQSIVRAELGEEVDVTAAQMLAAEKGHGATQLAQAEAWVRQYLADASRPSAQMDADAEAIGIAKKTLVRACKGLGVRSEQRGGKWWRELPAGEPRI